MMKKTMETTLVYWGYIGIIEGKMETSTVDWVYILFAMLMPTKQEHQLGV